MYQSAGFFLPEMRERLSAGCVQRRFMPNGFGVLNSDFFFFFFACLFRALRSIRQAARAIAPAGGNTLGARLCSRFAASIRRAFFDILRICGVNFVVACNHARQCAHARSCLFPCICIKLSKKGYISEVLRAYAALFSVFCASAALSVRRTDLCRPLMDNNLAVCVRSFEFK